VPDTLSAPGVTRTDQVSALEVEAIELIACLLGVVYVLVDHKCCALGVVGNALTDLTAKREKKKSDGLATRIPRCKEGAELTE
jgi:hypothetical protein